ncbi:hypothetical protein FACS189414_3650 [Bacteroidia bacterium]|nr:hypothetical protein FACS189414_3650 [Bacteroidia bacterium]
MKAGEAKTITFALTPAQVAARDNSNQAQVVPGKILVSVGGKQPDSKSLASKQVVQKEIQVSGDVYFID